MSRGTKIILGLISGVFLVMLVLTIYRPVMLGVWSEKHERIYYLDFENEAYYGDENRNGLSLSLRRSGYLDEFGFELESDFVTVKAYDAEILYEGIWKDNSLASLDGNPSRKLVLLFYVEDKLVHKELFIAPLKNVQNASLNENYITMDVLSRDGENVYETMLGFFKIEDAPIWCTLYQEKFKEYYDTEYVVCYGYQQLFDESFCENCE